MYLYFTETPQRSGRFIARHVGIPELDQRFKDVAEIFNLQQGHREAMAECLSALRDRYGCSHGDGLSEYLKRIKEEHGECPFLHREMRGDAGGGAVYCTVPQMVYKVARQSLTVGYWWCATVGK